MASFEIKERVLFSTWRPWLGPKVVRANLFCGVARDASLDARVAGLHQPLQQSLRQASPSGLNAGMRTAQLFLDAMTMVRRRSWQNKEIGEECISHSLTWAGGLVTEEGVEARGRVDTATFGGYALL